MPRTKALTGKTVIGFRPEGNGEFLPFAAVRTANLSGQKLNNVDITNMDSEGSFKEIIPTTFDGGTLAIEGIYISNDPSRLAAREACYAKQLCDFQIIMPKSSDQNTAGDTTTFQGYFNPEGTSFDYSKEVTSSINVDVTGPVTYATGS